jgi:thiol-disulfide isomerase/thioredoxin
MRRRLALALLIPVAFASTTFATPPTDTQIDSLIKTISEAKAPDGADGAAKRQARRDAAKEAMKDLAINEASLAQLQSLTKKSTAGNPELAEAVDARLVELAKATTTDGARAAELRLQVIPTPEKPTGESMKARTARMAELCAEVLKHLGAADMFNSGGGENVFKAISSIPAADARGAKDLLKQYHLVEAITPHITTELSPTIVTGLARLIHPLVEGREEIGAANVEAFRTRVLAAVTAALPKAEKDRDDLVAKAKDAVAPDPEDKDAVATAKLAETTRAAAESMVARVKDTRTLLGGPWARGELVDHPAPAIAFEWTSSDKPLKSFADLKGKVVLVDFWATWCGPCVAAFPKMRELQTRYSGYPVVILGVTSNQGSRVVERTPGQKPKTVDCSGDPAKEHAMMTEFMRDMEMTWTVAFSEQNVFNPDFGVRGIPSVAIIGPDGNVRFAGLYPNPKEESDHIDALLKEAKLPYPEIPYVEPPKKEKKEEAKKDDAKKDDGKADEAKKEAPKKG